MKVGDFLLKVVFWSGMSQVDVAKKCNISTPSFNEIIKNKRNINIRYAKEFEELFGIPAMIWLMWDTIDKLNEEN